MKQIIVFCLMLTSLVFAQRQGIVVFPSVADDDAKFTSKQLDALTEEVRTIITKTLPQKDFNLLKQDDVVEALGGEDSLFKACSEKTCFGSLMAKFQEAKFGTRCDVYIVDKQLYLKFELYGTLKGESEAGTIRQESYPVKDFAEMQAVIKKEVPPILDLIGKSEQERCTATPGKMWVDGDCVTGKELAQKDCLQKSSEGYVWDGESCKSREQIICEGKKGHKWEGNECKSPEQQDCEKQTGKVWQNGGCKSAVAVPVPASIPSTIAPRTGGGSGYTAQVHTDPIGASVNVNGAPYCHTTPCPISVYERSVRLTATMDDHETADTTLTITMQDQVVNLKLKPKTYSVSFTSEPSGASLALDGYGKCETPCRMNLAKGRVKMTAGSDRFYDRKDTTVLITGISNQQINLKLNPNFGTLELIGARGWDLRVDDADYGNSLSNIKLLPGTHKIRLTDSDYEDIEFSMDIRKNERKTFDISDKIVHRYGHLNINPSYSSGIGENENWYLQIDGESYSFGDVKLLHGEHQVKLTHRCYEDINLEAKIERNGNTSLDIQDKVSLKQGTLVLRAKRKVRNITMPVFVNGKQVGETPYEGSIPICSEVKMGKDGKESVPVKLEHNKPVEYTYKDGTYKSHWLGAVLNITGAVLIGSGIFMLNDRDNTYKEYSDLKPVSSPGYNNRDEYDIYWKDVESAHSEGNTYLILGGAIFALGIGVHVWF